MKAASNNHLYIRLIIGMFTLALVETAGCQSLRFLPSRRPAPPIAFEAVPDKNQLVAAIQRNTDAVKQLDSSVKVSMDGMPTVSGTLLLERPNRMRLKVGFLGMTGSGLDVGSNDELFWIWNKSSIGDQSPAIYFARHDEYRNSQLQRSSQLQPQWIIDAMGLLEFDTTKPIEGPFKCKDGRYEIRTEIASPAGPMKRRTIIDPRYGWIVQQSIYDPQNRLVVWANSKSYRYFPEHNASLPQHVELHVIDASGGEQTLNVQFLNHEINALFGDPQRIWTMPNPADVPQVDLTKVRMDNSTSQLRPGANLASQNQSAQNRPWKRPKLRGFDWK